MGTYRTVYERSLADPASFWAEAAAALHWDRPWETVLDESRRAVLSLVQGRPAQHLLQCGRPACRGRPRRAGGDHPRQSGDRQRPDDHLRPSCRTWSPISPGRWSRSGVDKGDRVIVYMPMVPEALVAMLACARIGAVHSVVFGGFAANELATRIDDAKPVLIVSASCGVEGSQGHPLQAAARPRDRARPPTSPGTRIILQRPQAAGRADAGPRSRLGRGDRRRIRSTACRSRRPIRSTSSTPPARPASPRASCATMAATPRHCSGPCATSTASSPARSTGPPRTSAGSSATATSSTRRCSTAARPSLYEGKPVGTPDPGAFWRVIAQHKVAALFTAPTAFRAIKKEDPEGNYIRKYDLSSLRTLFLAGERCDPDTLLWAEAQLGVPVIDHWWQTETGWAIAANPMGVERLPVRPGSPTLPMVGYDVQILDEEGAVLPAGQMGAICIRLPMPPGCLATLWHADERLPPSLSEPLPRLVPDRRRRLQGRGRLSLHHEPHRRRHQRGRPPAVDRRAWRRCWPRTRMSPSAR